MFYPGENRPTSVGYRLKSRSSEFHQNCTPKERRTVQIREAEKPVTEAELLKANFVNQDKIHRETVDQEKRGAKQWEENWGFLTEFDSKGNPIKKEELPDKVTFYSEDIPPTNSANYGSRLKTDVGTTVQKLEFAFHAHNRKKKLDSEMVCY
ncbi:DgyrCDS8564 [Dimorphilus gyrociliatus]|uniref:DgyrCDS8564 n=1 Tax=Dimorphilus gyrociliatus TaxID=2664684 RepID=A0A7I8VUI1_9ANNE|nr:DgyrCDS8564 [Dimorphilus gyrociliatus]